MARFSMLNVEIKIVYSQPLSLSLTISLVVAIAKRQFEQALVNY